MIPICPAEELYDDLEDREETEEDAVWVGTGEGEGEPNKRRVDENNRDGSLRVDENWSRHEVLLNAKFNISHFHSNPTHTSPSMEPNSSRQIHA